MPTSFLPHTLPGTDRCSTNIVGSIVDTLRLALASLLLVLSAACGNDYGSATNLSDGAKQLHLPQIDTNTHTRGNLQTSAVETATGAVAMAKQSPAATNTNGKFQLRVIDTQNRGFSDALRSRLNTFLLPAIEAINRVVTLPQVDIPVTVQACSISNAYYLTENPEIYLCMELLDDSVTAFTTLFNGNRKLALLLSERAYSWFAYHEVAHALHHQLDLPIAGNTESAADSIATVLTVEKGDAVDAALAALLFINTGSESFEDIHPGGTDRAGDMICWVLGGDPTLAQTPSGALIAQKFVDEGRDCINEYATQHSAVQRWIPGLSPQRANAVVEGQFYQSAPQEVEQIMQTLLQHLPR